MGSRQGGWRAASTWPPTGTPEAQPKLDLYLGAQPSTQALSPQGPSAAPTATGAAVGPGLAASTGAGWAATVAEGVLLPGVGPREGGVMAHEVDGRRCPQGNTRYDVLREPGSWVHYRGLDTCGHLSLDSPPLPRAAEVVGFPIAELHLATSDGLGDVFVYLQDVDPGTGRVAYVTEGMLRLGHRAEGGAPAHGQGAHGGPPRGSAGDGDVSPARGSAGDMGPFQGRQAGASPAQGCADSAGPTQGRAQGSAGPTPVHSAEGQPRAVGGGGPALGSPEREAWLPGLPYHSFCMSDWRPMVPGQPDLVRISLMPTAYRFAQGHKVRLSIAGGDAKNFPIHGVHSDQAGPRTLWVHWGGPKPSRVRLPLTQEHGQAWAPHPAAARA